MAAEICLKREGHQHTIINILSRSSWWFLLLVISPATHVLRKSWKQKMCNKFRSVCVRFFRGYSACSQKKIPFLFVIPQFLFICWQTTSILQKKRKSQKNEWKRMYKLIKQDSSNSQLVPFKKFILNKHHNCSRGYKFKYTKY